MKNDKIIKELKVYESILFDRLTILYSTPKSEEILFSIEDTLDLLNDINIIWLNIVNDMPIFIDNYLSLKENYSESELLYTEAIKSKSEKVIVVAEIFNLEAILFERLKDLYSYQKSEKIINVIEDTICLLDDLNIFKMIILRGDKISNFDIVAFKKDYKNAEENYKTISIHNK